MRKLPMSVKILILVEMIGTFVSVPVTIIFSIIEQDWRLLWIVPLVWGIVAIAGCISWFIWWFYNKYLF